MQVCTKGVILFFYFIRGKILTRTQCAGIIVYYLLTYRFIVPLKKLKLRDELLLGLL